MEERRASLGGSELGSIPSIVRAVGGDPAVDCPPWASEWRIWSAKVHGSESQPDTPEMAVGRWLEQPILEWAIAELGGVPIPPSVMPHFAPGYVWREYSTPLSGTPDGWVDWRDREAEGIEVKVSGDWQPWERPPLHYELQCRAYLYLTGAPRWHLAAFFRVANARRLYVVEYDPTIEAQMVEAARSWWQRHIVEGIPPEVDASADCARALGKVHPRTAGASFADFRIATDAEIRLAIEAYRLDELADAVKADAEQLKNELRSAIGDAPGLRWTGGSVRWSRNRIAVKLENDT